MDEVKPCLYCGKRMAVNSDLVGTANGSAWTECVYCGACGPASSSRSQAIKYHNTYRAEQPEPIAVLKGYILQAEGPPLEMDDIGDSPDAWMAHLSEPLEPTIPVTIKVYDGHESEG